MSILDERAYLRLWTRRICRASIWDSKCVSARVYER